MRVLRLALVAAPLVGIQAAAATGAATDWVEVKGPAFTVVSDASQKDARRVSRQFDQVRALLKEVWPWASLDPPRPVMILAVRDEGGLKRLLPAYWEHKGHVRPGGVFVSAPDRNWVALRMDVSRFREDDEAWANPYLLVFHEYVHLVLRLNFGALPTWLDEGLAEFWGNAIIEDDRVYEGRHILYHLLTLRERAPMPLARLFAVTHASPEYSEGNRATIFYAESWALVHYLAIGADARKGQLNRLVTLLKAGKRPDEAAREAFGDLAALDRELQSYVRQRAFRYRKRAVGLQLAAEQGPVRTLPAAESLALRAGFHAAMGREVEVRALAAEALALDASTAGAHEALGLLAYREGKRDEARQALARAVALPGASDYSHFLYGHLLWESLPDTVGLEAVEASFRKAVEKNTQFADAYQALARVMADRGEPVEKALPLAVRAAQLEPGVIEHRITALRLAARADGGLESRAQAEVLLGRVEGEDRAKVEALIQELSDPRLLSPEAACDAGNAPACAELGARHRDGLERPRDPGKATGYFEKACAGGEPASCGSAGWALERGDGVAKDLPRALVLFRKGCGLGDRWSCTHMGLVLLTGQVIAADPAEAARLFEGSCGTGDVTACVTLGSMLRQGRGAARNVKRAEALLTGPCDSGSAPACGELGLLFAAAASPASLRRAASLFDKACEAGSAASCANLATLAASGQGVARDPARARALYRRACDGGYAEACVKADAR